jgi:hypothetical protein
MDGRHRCKSDDRVDWLIAVAAARVCDTSRKVCAVGMEARFGARSIPPGAESTPAAIAVKLL